MKRSLPSPLPTGLPPDQEEQLLQQGLQGLREERGPGGSLITERQGGGAGIGSGDGGGENNRGYLYYRSESTASVNSYYSTSSTNTAFGSSLHGGIGTGGAAAATAQRQSSSASLSSSSLDCFNSIGSSLKRVKISTSPGELRLNKDIEAMARNKLGINGANDGNAIQWVSVDEAGGSIGSASASGGSSSINNGNAGNGGVHYHRALRSADGSIVVRRDVVDPLRLRISVTFRTNENPYWHMVGWGVYNNNTSSGGSSHSTDGVSTVPQASSSSPCYETWHYLVQIPRMYPHSAPLVVRITREGGMSEPSTIPELVRKQRQEQQKQMQQQRQQNQFQQQHSFQQYSSENTAERSFHPSVAAAAPAPVSDAPPMVERILVSSNPSIHPPSAEEGEMTGICVDKNPLTSTLATYGSWSPISRLSDLVTFLAELPVKRLAAWSAARGRSAGGGDTSTASNGAVSSHHYQHQSQQQFQSDSYPRHEERRRGEDGSKRGVVRRHISSNHYDYNDYNDTYMDTGEPTIGDASHRPSHLDRQRRRTSQESEVDVRRLRLAGSSHSGSEQDVTANDGAVSRVPAKLEDPFHPNRFNQGFDRYGTNDGGNGTLSSLWRSESVPDVATQTVDTATFTPGLGQTAYDWGAASTAANSSFDATEFRQSTAEDSSMMDDDL